MSNITYYDEFMENKNDNKKGYLFYMLVVLGLTFLSFIMLQFIKKFIIISYFNTNVIQQLFLEGLDYSFIVFIFSINLFEPILFIVIFIIASFIMSKYYGFPLIRTLLISLLSFSLAFVLFHIAMFGLMYTTSDAFGITEPSTFLETLIETIINVFQNIDPISDIIEISDIIVTLVGNLAYYMSYNYIFLDNPSIFSYFLTFYIGKVFTDQLIYDIDYFIILIIYIFIFTPLFFKLVKPCQCNISTLDKIGNPEKNIKGIFVRDEY